MDIIQMSINQGTNKQIDTYQNTTQQGKGMMQQLILQSSMLNERSQTQKTTYCIIPLIINSRKGKTIVIESRSVVAKD